jgi:hypothetical protein
LTSARNQPDSFQTQVDSISSNQFHSDLMMPIQRREVNNNNNNDNNKCLQTHLINNSALPNGIINNCRSPINA